MASKGWKKQPRDSKGRWTTSGGGGRSGLNGMSASKMSNAQKIQAAKVMYGSGSKQHKAAQKKFGSKSSKSSGVKSPQAQKIAATNRYRRDADVLNEAITRIRRLRGDRLDIMPSGRAHHGDLKFDDPLTAQISKARQRNLARLESAKNAIRSPRLSK